MGNPALLILCCVPMAHLGAGTVLRNGATATTPDSPVVNIHVQEARDAFDKQRFAEEHRSKRRQLVELEEMELFEREFLANMMAPITAQIAKLVDVAEKRTRWPAS